jgi:tetratricopeptide (TPR) repeat protein
LIWSEGLGWKVAWKCSCGYENPDWGHLCGSCGKEGLDPIHRFQHLEPGLEKMETILGFVDGFITEQLGEEVVGSVSEVLGRFLNAFAISPYDTAGWRDLSPEQIKAWNRILMRFEDLITLAPPEVALDDLALLALAARRGGDLNMSDRFLDRLEALSPDHLLVRLHRAVNQAHRRNGKIALAQLGAIQASPEPREVVALARALEAVGRALSGGDRTMAFEQALELVRPLLEPRPPYIEAFKVALDTLGALDRWSEVLGLAAKALEAEDDLELKLARGRALVNLDTNSAAAYIAELRALHGDQPGVVSLQMKLLIEQEQLAEALTLGLSHRDMPGVPPWLHRDLGKIMFEMGRYDEACQAFSQALELDPGWTEVEMKLGQTMGMLGRYEDGAQIYRSVLERDPGNIGARLSLGAALTDLGQHEEALGMFEAVLVAEPDKLAGLLLAGNAAESLGRKEKALAYNMKALQFSPGNPAATAAVQRLQ